MPAPRESIVPAVIAILKDMSGETSVDEDDDLEADLGLSGDLRRALAPALQRVARASNPSAVIRGAEVASKETVGDVIDLVAERG